MKNKIYKLLSIVLTVMLVFSCCAVAFTAVAEEEAEPVVYYIDANGSDTEGDGTAEKPYLSVKEALKKATADGTNVEGGVVTIHATNTAGNTSVDMWGTNTTADPYPSVNCNLTITADTALTRVHDADGGVCLTGTGTLTFNNIWFTVNSYSKIGFGNMNTTIGKGSKIQPGSYEGYLAIGAYNNNSTTTTPYYINILGEIPTNSSNNNYKNYGLFLCDYESNRDFKNNIYVTYDNAEGSQEFVFGCGRKKVEVYTKYWKPVSFNIKSAKSITFSSANVQNLGYGGYKFEEGGLIQVINSSGAALTGLDTIVTANKQQSDFDQDNTPVTKWILTNQTTEFKNAIDFTDTVGLYDVAEGYTVVATKVDDSSVVVTSAAAEGSQDVMLDLREYGAGEYNLTVTKQPEIFTYYIASAADGGLSTNDGLSADKPMLTVNEVITAANEREEITKADTIEVKVVGGATSANAATWGTDIACNANNITVSSNDSTSLSYFTTPTIVSNVFEGNVFYDNLNLLGVAASSNPNRIASNGRNITFGSNVTMSNGSYRMFLVNQTVTVNHPITVTVKNAYKQVLSIAHWNSNGIVFKDDVTYIIDNASATPSFVFSSHYDSASATKMQKNLNFVIYDASSVAFGAKGSKTSSYYNISGAVQVINPSDITVDLTNLTKIGKDDTAPTGGIYHIIDGTGVKYGVEFVPAFEAGKYKLNIDRDFYNVYVTPEGGEKTLVEGEYIVVDQPGTYTVTKEKKSNLTANYYVSVAGSNDNDGETAETPLLTVDAALQLAVNKGYAAGDTVRVNIIGSETVESHLIPAYEFKAVIRANDPSVKANLKGLQTDEIKSNLGGDTLFESVAVQDLGFNNKNVEFDENSTYTKQYAQTGHTLYANEVVNGQTIIINLGSVFTWNLGNSYGGNIYNAPLHIVVNNYTNSHSTYSGFVWGADNGVTEYNSAVNINMKKANFVLFKPGKSGTYTFGEDFALQLINSTGKPVLKTGDQLYHYGSYSTLSKSGLDELSASQKYILTNNTGNKEIIDFTPTVGVYSIDPSIDTDVYFVRATSVTNSSVHFDSKDGFLTVDPGEYNITIEKRTGLQITYFVGGTDASDETGDGTEAKPFATVAKALATATAKGYGDGNTITVKLLSDVTWGTAVEAVRDYQVVIDSDLETTPTIDFAGKDITLGGDLEFKNVKNNYGGDGWRALCFHGGNVTFSAKTATPSYVIVFGWGAEYAEDTPVAGQTVVFNSGVSASYIRVAHSSNGILHYTDDLNVIINNKNANPRFGFEPDYNNYTKLDSGVCANFYIKKASSFAVADISGNNSGTAKLDGAIQILVDDSTTKITDDTKTFLNETLKPAEGVYIIRNNTGIDGLLSTVKNSRGVYAVDLSKLDTVRYNLMINGEAADIVDGYITVPAQGEYEFTLTTNPVSEEFYVQNGATEGDGTSKKPFATVAEVIDAANAMKLTTGDVVTVKVIGNETVQWGTAAAYEFLLKVVSNEAGNMSTVYIPDAMTGDASFDDIKISLPTPGNDNPYIFHTGGYNVTFGANAKIDAQIVTALQGKSYNNPITQVYNNAFTYSNYSNIALGNSVQNFNTFNSDVTYVINNPAAKPQFSSMPYYGGTITYNANLNINVKDAASVVFTATTCEAGGVDGRQAGSVTVNGAFQLIIPSDVTLSETTLANLNNIIGTKYILRSNVGNVLDFTVEGGKYAVAEGYTVVALNAEGEQVATAADGVLDLSAIGAGEYTIVCTAETDVTVDDVEENNGYDIRDLVAVAMYLEDNNSVTLNQAAADKDDDGDVDADDLAIIRWELLTGETYTPDTTVATLSGLDIYDKKEYLAPVAIKEQEKLDI